MLKIRNCYSDSFFLEKKNNYGFGQYLQIQTQLNKLFLFEC